MFSSTGNAASAATTKNSLGLTFNFNKPMTAAALTTAPTGLSLTTPASSFATAAPPLSIPSKATSPPDSKVDVKEDFVPPEIVKDVTAFKEYIKKEKEESNEIARSNTKALHKITEEVNQMSLTLATISQSYQRNISVVKKLRSDLSSELQNAENAHITQNMTPTMQLDNALPVTYFNGMIRQFENNMTSYQVQIDELEQHLHALNNPQGLTAQDISTALTKMHESFITLASNLHSVHSRVAQLKEQYLIYRRLVCGDTTDIFADKNKVAVASTKPTSSSNENNLSNVVALAMASILQHPQQTATVQQTFNTAAPAPTANTGGLFGAKPATNIGGGLFGSKPAPSAGGLFGAKPAVAANTGGGGLFGSKPAVASTGGTGLFGAKPAATAPAPATGGLFGSATSATGGGLFGGGNKSLTTTNKPSLFGSATQQSSGTTSTSTAGTLFSGGAKILTPSSLSSANEFNSSAGLTFGGAAGKHGFDLKPPTNAKRNKS